MSKIVAPLFEWTVVFTPMSSMHLVCELRYPRTMLCCEPKGRYLQIKRKQKREQHCRGSFYIVNWRLNEKPNIFSTKHKVKNRKASHSCMLGDGELGQLEGR